MPAATLAGGRNRIPLCRLISPFSIRTTVTIGEAWPVDWPLAVRLLVCKLKALTGSWEASEGLFVSDEIGLSMASSSRGILETRRV